MRIEAATLAGGKVNQDYYAYGETYALVLDGATSFVPEKTSIDAATYVQALGAALAIRLESCELGKISEVVSESIEEVAQKHELVEKGSPSSTITIAKWNKNELAIYALGDSSCLIINSEGGLAEVTDDRMHSFGNSIRQKYKNRLLDGYGFDEQHKKNLKDLQKIQESYRNKDGGYWIASNSGESGKRGIYQTHQLRHVERILIMSDGGKQSLCGELDSFAENIYSGNIEQLLMNCHQREDEDYRGIINPRSKLHDDKTVILVDFKNNRLEKRE